MKKIGKSTAVSKSSKKSSNDDMNDEIKHIDLALKELVYKVMYSV